MLNRNLDILAGLTNGAKVVLMNTLPYILPYNLLQVSTLKDGTIHWIPPVLFILLHGKAWMLSVFSFQSVSLLR